MCLPFAGLRAKTEKKKNFQSLRTNFTKFRGLSPVTDQNDS